MYRSFKPSILQEKSKAFSARIIKMHNYLLKEKHLNSINNQALRSGTPVYANVNEAQFAESPSDFVHKLSIALKEANETMGWIEMFHKSDLIDLRSFESISSDCQEIIAMLVASINTTKKNFNL